jgi:hypothetical protein
MRFGDLLARRRAINSQAAVVDECIAHLRKAEAGEYKIPLDGEEDYVAMESIVAVREKLELKKDQYFELLEQIEDVEVADVEFDEGDGIG